MGDWELIRKKFLGLYRIARRPVLRMRKSLLFGQYRALPFANYRQHLAISHLERKNLKKFEAGSTSKTDYLFLHIPKTAGTSIKAELEGVLGFKELKPQGVVSQFSKEKLISNHLDLNWLVTHRVIARPSDRQMTFAVVRNPFTRARSLYRYFLHLGRIPHEWSLEEFLTAVEKENPRIGGAKVARFSQAAPQQRWFVKSSWNGPIDVYFFENLSRLASDLSELFEVSISFKHLNESIHPPSAISMSQEAVSLIKRLYHEDFTIFGYSIDPSEEISKHDPKMRL